MQHLNGALDGASDTSVATQRRPSVALLPCGPKASTKQAYIRLNLVRRGWRRHGCLRVESVVDVVAEEAMLTADQLAKLHTPLPTVLHGLSLFAQLFLKSCFARALLRSPVRLLGVLLLRVHEGLQARVLRVPHLTEIHTTLLAYHLQPRATVTRMDIHQTIYPIVV